MENGSFRTDDHKCLAGRAAGTEEAIDTWKYEGIRPGEHLLVSGNNKNQNDNKAAERLTTC